MLGHGKIIFYNWASFKTTFFHCIISNSLFENNNNNIKGDTFSHRFWRSNFEKFHHKYGYWMEMKQENNGLHPIVHGLEENIMYSASVVYLPIPLPLPPQPHYTSQKKLKTLKTIAKRMKT